MNSLEFIHSMVAPAVAVSACGLLLLSMNNKYSLVVNRIRLLNQEYRSGQCDENRKQCIKRQIPLLRRRMLLIKNAVWFYTLSVILAVVSMIEIAVELLSGKNLFYLVIPTFVLAVLCILIGSVFAARETSLGFSIVSRLEIGSLYDD